MTNKAWSLNQINPRIRGPFTLVGSFAYLHAKWMYKLLFYYLLAKPTLA